MACVGHPGVCAGGRPLTSTGSATIKRRIRPAGGQNSRLSFEINAVRRFGRVSRVAKGADCKSAVLRLRRFESYLSHQPSRPTGASVRRAGTLREGGPPMKYVCVILRAPRLARQLSAKRAAGLLKNGLPRV